MSMGSIADRNPQFRVVPPDGSSPWPEVSIPEPAAAELTVAGTQRDAAQQITTKLLPS